MRSLFLVVAAEKDSVVTKVAAWVAVWEVAALSVAQAVERAAYSVGLLASVVALMVAAQRVEAAVAGVPAPLH